MILWAKAMVSKRRSGVWQKNGKRMEAALAHLPELAAIKKNQGKKP